MLIPQALIQSLQHIQGFDKKAFEDVHAGGQVTSIRNHPLKLPIDNSQWPIDDLPFTLQSRIPWSSFGYYLDNKTASKDFFIWIVF